MKRKLAIILAALAALVLFYVLVHAVLVAAQLSESAPNTVYGMTPRRIWASIVAALALVSVVIGGLALRRSVRGIGNGGRNGAVVGSVAGLIAAVNGVVNLAIATGGPGSGNGVVGAAGAIVLGVIAMALGGITLARSRRRSAIEQR